MNTMMKHELATIATLAFAAALTAATAAPAQCPPKYEVTVLIEGPSCGNFGPSLPKVSTINEHGQAAGGVNCPGGPPAPFVWSERVGINVLLLPPGISSAAVNGINNVLGIDGLGQMAGTMTPSGMPFRAFLLDDGEWTNLELLPGSTQSFGSDLNDSKTVVGLSTNNVTGPLQAFKWTDGVMTALPGLDGPNSSAGAINSSGQITGWMGDGQITDAVAFIWHDGNVTALPPVPGGTTSRGKAINVHGDVAGDGKFFDPEWDANTWRGFAYIDGEMIRIDPLPGFKDLVVRSMNSSGQVVGYMNIISNSRGILWQNGTTYDLNDLVPPGTPLLHIGRVIDDDGRIYAGSPIVANQFLLTPIPALAGDLDCDGTVGVSDLLILLGAWGECDDPSKCPADLNGDGHVGVADLLILLAKWG